MDHVRTPARATSNRAARVLASLGAATAVTAATTTALVAGPAHAAPARPDLVVTAVGWAGQPAAGQEVVFEATITNRGRAATPAGVIHGVQFKVDGRMTTWSDTSTASLKPGQSRTVRANWGPAGKGTWTATAGEHSITAHVDDARRIAESNETNNLRSRPLSVRQAPAPAVRTTVTTLPRVSVHHELGASAHTTFVQTELGGDLSAACFSQGHLVRGTERDMGRAVVGRIDGWPGGPSSTYVNTLMIQPAATTTTASTDAVLASILRDRNWQLERFPCEEGQTAGWHEWTIRHVTSARFSHDTGEQVGEVFDAAVENTYAFPTPL